MNDQMKQKPMKMMKAMRTHIMTMMRKKNSTIKKSAKLVGRS
jgi:hypothetical protein